MQEYNICYSLDSKYAEQFCVSAVSILKNADVDDNINFYILDGGLTKQDKTNIELLKNIKNFNIEYLSINKADFKNCPMLKDIDENHKDYHVTLPTYFRFKLPQLLPKLDKVLYLDCDVIVRSSLKELYSLSLKDKAAAMIEDVETKREAKRLGLKQYFNAGVMLINLDFWRKNDVETKLFDFSKENRKKILWQDQDVINCVLSGQIKAVSNKWNYQYFLYDKVENEDLANCSILHLAGRFKPWLMPFEHFVYDFYYCYLALTPYRNRVIAYKQASGGKYLKNDIGGSETNILHKATSEDVEKIYNEINKTYDFTKEQIKAANDIWGLKISDVQKEIGNVYKTYDIEQLKSKVVSDVDLKLNGVYEEISKNYEYTNELNETSKQENVELENKVDEKISQAVLNSTEQTDEKISKVYEEISKNYEYTNELNETSKQENVELENRVDEKITQAVLNSTEQTDEKISKVYEEITKNYEYTNGLNENSKKENAELENRVDEKITQAVLNSTKQTDEKISKVYEEITKNYEYTNDIRDNLVSNFNSAKQNLYDEITSKENLLNEKMVVIERNLLDGIDNVSQSIKKETATLYEKIAFNDENLKHDFNELKHVFLEQLNRQLEFITSDTDEKISKVYDEISKNYDYTNKLKEELSVQTNLKIEEINKEISENYNYTNSIKEDIENKLQTAQSNIYSYIEHSEEVCANNTAEKINGLETKLNEKISALESEQNRKNDLKISEVYSYTNSELTKVFKQVNENSSNLEHKIELKSYDAYKWFEENRNEINQVKNKLTTVAKISNIKELEDQFAQKLQSLDEQHQKQVAQLNTDFEEKLNAQRIKYENKLMTMENQISALEAKYLESQKGFFVKMIEKCKKR